MIQKNLFSLFIIVALFFSIHTVSASSDLTFTGSVSFTGTTGIANPITDLQISGTTPTSTPVKLRVTYGTLSMSTTAGLTFTGSPTGSTLQFSGTVADINAALATLTYTRVGTGNDTLEASLVNPGEVFFSGTNHLYEYISSTLTWTNAKTAAENLPTRYGANGYLATITSQEENDFVSARLSDAGWMGASDAASENDWKWVTGPEAGTSFWFGAVGGSTVPGQYSNWNTSEPNDSSSNEDCGQFLAGGSGKWNDLPCTGTTLPGYVAEFGAPGNMPIVASKDITLTTLSGPLAPTSALITNATTTTLDVNWTSGAGSETSFLVEQSEGDCSGSFTQIASVDSSTTTYTVTGLSPEIRYCFRIRATNGITNSAYATTSSDFTLPNDPLKPVIENVTETSLRVRIVNDNNPSEIAESSLYSIQEATLLSFLDYPNGGFVVTEGFTSSDAWNNNTLNGLSPNTPYSFKTRISKRNSAGGYTSYSPTSDVVYTLSSVPTTPTIVSKTTSTVSLSWTGNGTSYIISNDTLGSITPSASTAYTATGLTCGATYIFRISSLNGDGVISGYSPAVTVVTDSCPIVTSGYLPRSINNTEIKSSTITNASLGGGALCSSDQILTQNLKTGASNGKYHPYTKSIVKEVKVLQAHMNRLGFNSGAIDGVLGKKTDSAIKRMQKYLGTYQDGLIGPITRDLINNSCGEKSLLKNS